jgi:hypothetical protein
MEFTMKAFLLLGLVLFSATAALSPMARAESPAYAVADGKPWSMVGPNGREMTIIFFSDSKVRMKMGFMSRSMAWQPTKDGMCLTGGPGGNRCIRLEATDNGFIGTNGNEAPLVLTR